MLLKLIRCSAEEGEERVRIEPGTARGTTVRPGLDGNMVHRKNIITVTRFCKYRVATDLTSLKTLNRGRRIKEKEEIKKVGEGHKYGAPRSM